MKLQYTLVFLFSIFQFAIAQEESEKKIVFPQFETCEQDDQTGRSCFENEFKKNFKSFYKETEIASDYQYDREVVGSLIVDRRGRLLSIGFDSTESPIFMAIDRAIKKFPKLKASIGDNERPQDFNFQVKFILKRTKRLNSNALSIDIEFEYPETDDKNS